MFGNYVTNLRSKARGRGCAEGRLGGGIRGGGARTRRRRYCRRRRRRAPSSLEGKSLHTRSVGVAPRPDDTPTATDTSSLRKGLQQSAHARDVIAGACTASHADYITDRRGRGDGVGGRRPACDTPPASARTRCRTCGRRSRTPETSPPPGGRDPPRTRTPPPESLRRARRSVTSRGNAGSRTDPLPPPLRLPCHRTSPRHLENTTTCFENIRTLCDVTRLLPSSFGSVRRRTQLLTCLSTSLTQELGRFFF